MAPPAPSGYAPLMPAPPLLTRRTFVAAAAAALAAPAFALDDIAPGRIETLPRTGTAPEPRVRVWLPGGYANSRRRYRTLYMLDGQNAFAGDADGWNFAVDSRINRLVRDRRIAAPIVVAIDNLEEDRFLQYMPQAIYDRSQGELRAAIERETRRTGPDKRLVSAQFVRWVAERLKPAVDRRYRTRPGRLDTAIFGASQAGVMSGALFVEAQATFGLGACMSPNWPIYDRHFIDHPQLLTLWPEYFARLGRPRGRRLWLDHGTEMMDAGMAPHQAGIARRLVEQGWRPGRHLQTRIYQGAGHAYADTAVQMDELLAWLLA